MAVLAPFIASVSLYWLPNLGKFHDAEFSNWFGLFFLAWFVPSAVICVIVAFVAGWLRHRLNQKKNEGI